MAYRFVGNNVKSRQRTLVFCLTKNYCVVISADSLITLSSSVANCTTRKRHKVPHRAAASGCGLSRVLGSYWSDINQSFSSSATEAAMLSQELKAFLAGEIDQVASINYGSCGGGNSLNHKSLKLGSYPADDQ